MKNRTVFPHIQVNPAVRFGKPVIEGTRVPVDLVVGKLAGGMTVDELVGEFDLTRVQILAAFKYAAHVVSQESLVVA